MKNLTMRLQNRPGELARVGETLGRAGVSIEGGGMFVVDGTGAANFLVEDGEAGRRALAAEGIEVTRVDDVVVLRLNQEEPGQLGTALRKFADAGVNVVTQYSDHDHQLVLVAEDTVAAQTIAEQWMQERERRTAGAPAAQGKTRAHHYVVRVVWKGNTGSGTSSYTAYRRDHEIMGSEKGVIQGSSDPVFRGDRTRYNPEELLVASASACHMLAYLHLCAVNGVVVLEYVDDPTGEMEETAGGSGAFVRVDLHPRVKVAQGSDATRAHALHADAHKNCFIANSLGVPVFHHPMIMTA